MFEEIRRWRWLLLLLLLFCLCVAFKLNGSSVGVWDLSLHATKTNTPGLLLFKPQPIRSDEWELWTPAALSQSRQTPPFPIENPSLGAGRAPRTRPRSCPICNFCIASIRWVRATPFTIASPTSFANCRPSRQMKSDSSCCRAIFTPWSCRPLCRSCATLDAVTSSSPTTGKMPGRTDFHLSRSSPITNFGFTNGNNFTYHERTCCLTLARFSPFPKIVS